MTRSFPTAITLGFFLASSAATFAAPDTTVMPPMRHVVPHHVDFAKAKALAPSMAPAPHMPETDGLSRNDDDCNYGCIDH